MSESWALGKLGWMGSDSALMSSHEGTKDPQRRHWLKHTSVSKESPDKHLSSYMCPVCFHMFVLTQVAILLINEKNTQSLHFSCKLQGNKCPWRPWKTWVRDDGDALSLGLWSAARDRTSCQALRLPSSWVLVGGPALWNGTENEAQSIKGSSTRSALHRAMAFRLSVRKHLSWNYSRTFCVALKSRLKSDSQN